MDPAEQANRDLRDGAERPAPPGPEGVAPESGLPRGEPVLDDARTPHIPETADSPPTPRAVNLTLLGFAVVIVVSTAILVGLTTSPGLGVAVAIGGLVLAVGLNPVVWGWLRGADR